MREREKLQEALNDRVDRHTKRDRRMQSLTSAQRKEQEAAVKEILQGYVAWGTPITEGTP
jgi:hypothetical protein